MCAGITHTSHWQTNKQKERKMPKKEQNAGISIDWVLNLLSGMKFPEIGQAYDFIKQATAAAAKQDLVTKAFVLYNTKLHVYLSLENRIAYLTNELCQAKHFESHDKADESLSFVLNDSKEWKIIETVAILPESE